MYSQYTGYQGQQQPGQGQQMQQPSFMQQQRTGFPGQQPSQMGMGGMPGGMAMGMGSGMGMMPQQTGYPGMGVMGGMQPQQTGFRPQQAQQQQPQQAPQAAQPQQQYSFLSQPPPSLGGSDGRNPPQQQQQQMMPQQTGFQPTSNFGQVLRAQATGMPSGGLQPQMTGYPSALQAQPTGFQDPRLQMMAASFMPSNLSQPYQHGAPSFAQPTSAPLPQTFQSLLSNPSVRTPAVPWTLSRQEKKDYDQIFRAWTGGEGGGFIEGGMAQDVFGQSGLGREDLGKIWNLADLNNRGKLNLPEFHVAMGLIYRALNGNDIPDTLPAEMIPPSMRDIDSTVDFVKDLLRNDSSARNTPDINLPGTFQRQQPKDATVYKHDDTRSKGYQSSNRHLDRKQVRYEGEDSSADLDSIKRDLQNSNSVLEKSAKDLAERTEEDEELDQEMDELKYRVRRVKDDIEYVSKGKRTDEKDEERRKLERELLYLMHERLPELERKQEAREERKRKETRDGIRARDKRNDNYGRYDPGKYNDRDRDRGSYRDRDEDRYQGRDRSNDRSDRDRRSSRDEEYRRPRSPVRELSPPPAPREPSKPTPAPAAPPAKAAPSTASMTPEEKKAFIRQQAQERLQARMRALGMASEETDSGSGVDNSVQERLDREKKEAEEKAKNAEKEQETREAARRARLESVGGKSVDAPASQSSAPAKPSAGPLKSALKKPSAPPPPPSKGKGPTAPAAASAKAVPPPPVSRASSARVPVTAPAVSSADDEEDAEIKAKEEAHRKAMAERSGRLKRMQEEEEAAKREEEEYVRKREAARKPAEPKATAAPAQETPDASSPPASSAATTNPFLRLGQGIAAVASAAAPVASSFNPFHKVNAEEVKGPAADDSDEDSPPPPPPPPPAAPPAPIVTQAPVARKPAFAPPEEEWDVIGEKDNDSDSSDDEYIGSRAKRENIAKALFGGGSPRTPASPASPAPVSAATSGALKKLGGGDAPSSRGALFASIAGGGMKLKKTVTVEKGGPAAGKVIGDAAPPAHIGEARQSQSAARSRSPSPPPAPPAPVMLSPPIDATRGQNRQSVDWISGLAADGGRSPGGSMPSLAEGAEDDSDDQASAPISKGQSSGEAGDEEYDTSVTLLVRSLYPYEGQRDIDLSFHENLILQAHKSKDPSSPWWYGKLVKSGKSGWFPSNYVDQLHPQEAKTLYAYTGNTDEELSFEEGDSLSIVESTDPDWWKCAKDGVVYIVPAAYLELTEKVGATNDKPYPAKEAQSVHAALPMIVAPAESMQAGGLEPSIRLNSPHLSSPSDGHDSDSSADSMMSYAGDEGDNEESKRRREVERQRVLAAAGLTVSKDKPIVPPRKPMRRVSRRAAPPAPSRNRNSNYSVNSLEETRPGSASLTVPSKPARAAPSPDAYDRYEAVLERAKTAPISRHRSYSDARPASIASDASPSQPAVALTSPSQLSFPNYQSPQKESKLSGFMSRMTGAGSTAAPERKSTPMISGPINAVPMDQPNEGDELAGIGLTWSSLVDQSLLENLTSRDRKRQEAIFEFIATESAYVRDLQLIVEVFYRGLLTLLDDQTLSRIFSNVEELLIFNTTLLSSLEDRQRAYRLFIDQVGDLLAQEMPNIAVYTPYCVNQFQAIKLLKDMRDSKPDVADFLLKTRQNNPAVRSLDLSSFLLEPMQRLTRYPLLIKQVLNYTEENEDGQMLRIALESAEKVVLEVNESVRETENLERLRLLSEELWLGGEGRLDLTAPTAHMGPRRLLKEGQVTKTKSGRKLQLVLCNDIAVLIESRNLYRMPMPLHEISAKEGSNRDTTAFQIVQDFRKGGEPIALKASSAKDAVGWIQAINKARTAASTARERGSRDTRRSGGIGY